MPWIERNVRLGMGDYYGEPFRMTGYETRWTYRLFEYWPEEGEDAFGRYHVANQLRYKRAIFGTAKGNGKTPYEGALASEALCGPTAPISPLVLVAASALVQSDLVFGDFKSGITHDDSPLSKFVEAHNLSVTFKDGTPGEVKRVAAATGSNDGPRATKLLADELHEWLGAVADVFTVLDGAIGKRLNCQTIGISTAGNDINTLLGGMYTKGKRLASGELVDDEILFEWYECPRTVEVPDVITNRDDLEQWRAAIAYANPALTDGGFLHESYIRARFDGAQEMERFKWLRYHLNRWTKAEKSWLPAGKWADASRLDEPSPDRKGANVVLAFSGTYDRESAGLVAIFEDTNTVAVLGSWENEDDDNYEVPTEDVKARVRQVMAHYRVRRFMVNPNGWHGEMQQWATDYGERVVVEFDWMHQIKRKHDACSKFYTSVMTRELDHMPNHALTRHLESATLKETSEGAWITRINRQGPSIALAQAAVIAWDQVAAQAKKPKATLHTF